ncbi:hypothetical protein M407DRAFT_18328 [Tulasnella calospora MUT 4182]|uniref:Uncharacterized protein n=1 Tax=Tulasnella calospora MUT 4182 TaxID=1051891 RepID=A0A0C3LFZ7_9AGAM|nr:hypothetical protein M407DRAFT_18328 [Tulasnella calospora MUT 4182]
MPRVTVSEAKPSKLGWPYFRPRTEEEIKAARLGWPFFKPKAAYPNFDLYPPAYPHLEIYPDVSPLKSQKPVVIVSLPRTAPSYPNFDLYPAGYPNLVIYPDVLFTSHIPSGGSLKGKSLPVALPCPAPGYPDFDLYPMGYPNLEIYPAVTSRIVSVSRPAPKPVTVRLAAPAVVYPEFNLYPATYPTLVIYPSVASSRTTRVSLPKSESKVSVRLPSTTGYPVFDLYPAVYPNLVVYPLAPSTVRSKPASRCSEVFVLWAGYPTFDLYPAIYPWVTPYPPCSFQLARPIALSPESKPQRWVPRKTHKTLHDEWVAARPKLQIATPLLPPQPQPTAPLPALLEVSPPVAPAVRSRARSGTVVRPLAAPPRGQLPPPPLLPSLPPPRAEPSLHQSPASVSRSREELHALIFGQSEITAQDVVVSPVAEGPVTAIAISPPAQRAPSRRSPSLSPPGGIRVGLPSHPGFMVPGNRRSVAERRATFAMQDPSPSLARSNTTSRMSTARSLTVLAERDDVPGLPKSPKSPLSRSVSLSRMKTNDDLFKQRQSLLNSPRRPSTADSNPLSVLSEFPSPPVSARSSMVGSPAGPPRPISKLDTSKYPFLR